MHQFVNARTPKARRTLHCLLTVVDVVLVVVVVVVVGASVVVYQNRDDHYKVYKVC